MAYVFGSIWDRSNRNALNNLSKSVEQQGKSIQDLVAEGQLTPEQYANLISVINGFVKSGEIDKQDLSETVRKEIEEITNKIDKDGVGQIKWSNISQEVREQILGDVPPAVVGVDSVGTENIINDSVTEEKLTIIEKSSNLFNFETSIGGYYVNQYSQGGLTVSALHRTSDYIPVESSSEYYIERATSVSYYDHSKAFISGTNSAPGYNAVITTPENAKYLRFSYNSVNLVTQQMNYGGEKLPYEPYYRYIKNDKINHKTNLYNTDFYKPGKNLFNKNDVLKDHTINHTTGLPIMNLLRTSSNYIKLPDVLQFAFKDVVIAAWYDKDYKYLGYTQSYTAEKPPNTVYMRISVLNENIDKAQVEIGKSITDYEPFKAFIDDKFLPKTNSGSNNPSVANEDVIARNYMTEQNALEFKPNVRNNLNIPSYVFEDVAGHEDVTHPNVLYFENGWNGYKFWMVFTPYPMAQNKYENPSIVASNDNVTWDEPATNPVAPLEVDETYQFDPEILMRGNTMELWYMSATLLPGTYTYETKTWRKTSTDGVNWSARELMFDKKDYEIMRSFAMIYEDNKYKSWYNANDENGNYFMKYAESTDGKNWTSRTLDIELDEDFTFWHGDVYKNDDGRIDMIVLCQSETHPWTMFYSYSYDNINFTPMTMIVKPTRGTNRWDNNNLYKPALTKVGEYYYLYYSTSKRIGLTIGKNLQELGFDNEDKHDQLYPIPTVKSEMNRYTPEDGYTVFPEEMIVYTQIWSSSDKGWPTLAGILVTNTTVYGYNKVKQFFYPDNENKYYMRTARSSGTNGWTSWVEFTGA